MPELTRCVGAAVLFVGMGLTRSYFYVSEPNSVAS